MSGFRWLPLWSLRPRGTDRDSDASDSAVTSAVTLTVTRLGVVAVQLELAQDLWQAGIFQTLGHIV